MASNNGAMVAESNPHPVVRGMVSLSMARQIGVMVGLAVSIAVGVAVALWSQTPNYTLLYGSVGDRDIGEVLDVLTKLNIEYKVESSSGAVMVPTDAVHEARMRLASRGLPKSNSVGFELLQKDSGFGTSHAIEMARFQNALEGEIARSITVLQNVKSARVHLALPKQSVFIRDRKEPSASVIVTLYHGRRLEKGQIEAIIHMVSSSVPELEARLVTVVDQKGNLLNAKQNDDDITLSNKQFEYKKQIEDHLIERVENILMPLVGADALRTQVSADIDFTQTERTQERYNPDLPAVRSEQVQEQQSRLSAVQGVPGALSNQPPAAGTAPQVANAEAESDTASPLSTSKNSTRNYELDKTISHTRLATGNIKRLSIAVVVDNLRVNQEDGSTLEKPYSHEELHRITELVKQAVGFDVLRGDKVTVKNAAFRLPDPQQPLPELPIWEQGWFQILSKQLVGVLIALLLVFGVLRPTLRGLVTRSEVEKQLENAQRGAANAEPGDVKALAHDSGAETGNQKVALSADADPLLLEAPQNYEHRLEFAQKIVDDDAKRVAQMVKNWVQVDG